jgi:low affinity Fe/Cu permease
MTNLIIISIVVFILNIPFGYWRANVKRFSIQWYLAIHIPVPVVVAFRIFFEIGFTWLTYLFLVTAFFLGQKLGSIIYKYLKRDNTVSSCLFMDLYKVNSKG